MPKIEYSHFGPDEAEKIRDVLASYGVRVGFSPLRAGPNIGKMALSMTGGICAPGCTVRLSRVNRTFNAVADLNGYVSESRLGRVAQDAEAVVAALADLKAVGFRVN